MHLMVAGGVGAPPLYFLAERVSGGEPPASTVAVINGARTRDLLVGIEEFDRLEIETRYTTDDGTHGTKGAEWFDGGPRPGFAVRHVPWLVHAPESHAGGGVVPVHHKDPPAAAPARSAPHQ